VRGSKKPLEGRYILSEFDEGTGQVLGANSKKFVTHCGYLVRDRILVSAREWRQQKENPSISFVSYHDKELIWLDILQHFTLDTQYELWKEKVKIKAMQKMAKQFQAWKKKLYKTFVAHDRTPDFTNKSYVKLRPFWNEFVEFKNSEEGQAWMIKNQENAKQ